MTAPPRRRLLTGPATLALATAGCVLLVADMPPVSDHAYQFHLARRMLDGAELYVDVAASDMHPPLFTWLALVLEAVARAAGASGLALFPLAVGVTAAVAIALVWRVGPRSPLVLGALLLTVLPLSGAFFGQGEHIAVVLALPYLFAAAHERAPAHAAERAGIAVLAAVGLAMKPHFALIWLTTELYRTRSFGWRSLVRLEAVLIGAVFVLYVLLTALLHPSFFPLIPWIAELYPRFAPAPLHRLLLDTRTVLLLACVVAAWTIRDDVAWVRVARILACASIAAWVAVLLQLKGWGYHWYPVVAFSILAIAVRLRRPLLDTAHLLVPLSAAAAVTLAALQPRHTARLLGAPPTYLGPMLELVERHAPGRPVMALSQYIQAAFPLVGITDAEWPAPYAHLWMVGALRAGADAPALTRPDRWRWLEREIFDRTWAAIETADPPLLIVERPLGTGIDMRRYFEADARFRALFASARAIDTVGVYVIYARATRAPAAGGSAP